MKNSSEIRAKARERLDEARELANAALVEDRDLTPAEATAVKSATDEAKRLHSQAVAAGESEVMMDRLRNLDGPPRPAGDPRRKAWSREVLRATAAPGGGFKSINPTGSVLVPTSFSGTPVVEGQPPASVRTLIPTTTLSGTDRYAFLRQTVRTNNAATVAPGALKPTSVFSLERVEGKCSTIAHLSEPIHRRDLADAASLTSFVESELVYGVEMAAEAQIISGDGDDTGGRDNLTGLLETEHTLAQEFDTDLITTTRRALTSEQVLGNASTAWVLAPQDWEAFELASDDIGRPLINQVSSPVDVAQRRLWSLPVVLSNALPQGTGILGDFSGSAQIYVRENAVVDWSENIWRPDAISPGVGASDFQTNQVTFRCEERLGLAILKPSAFCVIALVAPAPSGGG